MRKVLLATTALVAVAFAGAAQAGEAPITVNLGGYVDFRAAHMIESTHPDNMASGKTKRREHDFETEYRLNVSAEGKAANGIQYGGLVSLWNGAVYNNTSGNNDVIMDQAYVWMSGAWGKLILGDDHGASDLQVYAPVVGEGQIDGTYTDFTDATTLMQFQPGFINESENSTKVTYYTPKVGNEKHKLQLGASYAPNYYDQGQSTIKYRNGAPTYQDYVEAVAQYTGNWSPVSTVLSASLSTAEGEKLATTVRRDYTSWGVGGQAMYAGWTLGASYTNAGKFNTSAGQNRAQDVVTVGVKYEFDKVALAANYLNGRGYNNRFSDAGTAGSGKHQNYVKDYQAFGLGATYTWFPGLTTAADAVMFSQERADTSANTGAGSHDNAGHVLMLSQKITF